MERRGISIDRQVLSRLSGEFAQTAARVEAEIRRSCRRADQCRQPQAARRHLFGKMGLPGGTKTKTGAMVDRRAQRSKSSPSRATNCRKKILEWRQVSKLKSTYTDALPGFVNPRPIASHHLRAGGDHHRAAVVVRAEFAEHSGAHRGRPQNPPRLYRRARHKLVSADYSQIELRLLAEIADIPPLQAGVPRRARHSRHDRVGNVRRAGQGHAGRGAPPRQGDQFRHHLRHLGVRARQPARHRREEAGAYIKKYFERFPGIRDYMEETKAISAAKSTAMSRRCSAANAITPTSRPPTPRSAPSTSAPRSTRGCRAPPPTSSAAP
jgi:DNA polymerase-1